MLTLRVDGGGHWLTVVWKVESQFLIITNIYGYNNDGQNKILMENITNVISELRVLYPTNLILVGGDWNMTPDEWIDRMPSRLTRPRCNNIVKSFMTENNLTDIWRRLHPDSERYSWFKPNGSNKSRIDYWLGCEHILSNTLCTSISKAPLTDHCFKGYWKFNAKLLQNSEYCEQIRELVKENENNDLFNNNMSRWEFIKFKIRQLSMQFSKRLGRDRKSVCRERV